MLLVPTLILPPEAPSLAEAVALAVREGIAAGELAPDTTYSVYQLADLLGVSRSPVREGLLRLAEAVRRRAFRPRAGAAAHPLFIVAGEDDPVHEGSRMLAQDLPGARFLGLPGRDHVSAVTSRVFRTAAAAFVADVEEARRSDPSPAGRPPASGR